MQNFAEVDEKVHIAWLYHMEGLTQSEIADRFGLSRILVHRILQKCQEEGIVKVVIDHPSAHCHSLASQMEKEFGLKNALVIPTSDDLELLKLNLGVVSGRFIGRYITSGTTIGVGQGFTIAQTARFIEKRNVDSVSVVSLLGGLTKSAASNSSEVALQISHSLDASCYNYLAPLIVGTQEERDTIRGTEHIKAVRNIIRRASIAIVGIGEVSTQCSLAESDLLNSDEIERLIKAGAVADIVGNFIDYNGNKVDVDVNRRVLSTSLDSLKEMENVFAVAGGLKKTQAILASLRSGAIDSLITDYQTAEQVLRSSKISS